MAKRKPTNKNNKIWSQPWLKQVGAYVSACTVVVTVSAFYFQNRERDLSNRFNDKLEFQKKDCDRDNEERYLKLKLEVQTEYYQQVDEKSETAKKLEKIFKRIDKTIQQ